MLLLDQCKQCSPGSQIGQSCSGVLNCAVALPSSPNWGSLDTVALHTGLSRVAVPICRDRIIAEVQERLLGPDGKLHPAEYTVTELALVETTDDDPTKVPPT